ncbi:zinc-finger-containing protein [Azospirillum sp. OGB3]|uniref:zinc-finger-containing protein n=1 Tax=Azospirillum sp. OGB3 TaxID=2587012 RepID=UPI001606117F|nr:zinc-finger-containing protein [Azospirillum sp. OGB3]
MLCSYCGMPTELLVDSSEIYGKNYGPIYRCPLGCGWVGCHPGTRKALGRIANRQLRLAKAAAHSAFDELWKRKAVRKGGSPRHYGAARKAGYAWLREQLGIDQSVCHIGFMNLPMCHRVMDLCSPYLRKR